MPSFSTETLLSTLPQACVSPATCTAGVLNNSLADLLYGATGARVISVSLSYKANFPKVWLRICDWREFHAGELEMQGVSLCRSSGGAAACDKAWKNMNQIEVHISSGLASFW